MVAKSIQIAWFGVVVLLTSCQMLPTDRQLSTHSETTRINQPEDVEYSPNSDWSFAVLDSSATTEITQYDPQSVVLQLQQDAEQLQTEGRWSEAALKLERALRIDANKIDLYYQLAAVRIGQDRFSEAEQIALKGLTLNDSSNRFRSPLWALIADCRSALGDATGAQEALAESKNAR